MIQAHRKAKMLVYLCTEYRIYKDVFLIVDQKCLFQHLFFSVAVLEHLTDHEDLNVLLNFWINEQAFIISF